MRYMAHRMRQSLPFASPRLIEDGVSRKHHNGSCRKAPRLRRTERNTPSRQPEMPPQSREVPDPARKIDAAPPKGRVVFNGRAGGYSPHGHSHKTHQRPCAGVKAAKARGVKFGRKPKLTPQQVSHAQKLIEAGDCDDVAALFTVGRKTLYRALEKTKPSPQHRA